MWWIVILAIVAWMAYKFFGDVNREGDRVASEGGMHVKYAELVGWALSGHPDCRIVYEDRTSIRVGASSAGGSTYFDFVQTFGSVTITWNSKSVLMGNDKLEWTFDEHKDQEEMIDKMQEDIANHFALKLKSYV